MFHQRLLKFTFLSRALLSLPFISALVGCGGEEDKQRKELVRSIKYEIISQGDSGQVRNLSGQVASANIDKVSFRIGGRVLTVKVDEGDDVKKGQLLATLDTDPIITDIRQAKLTLTALQADLVLKKRSYKASADLFEKDFVSEDILEKDKAALEKARSALNNQMLLLVELERNLNWSTLKSPSDGRVVVRTVDPADSVVRGQVLFEIHDQNSFEVGLRLPEQLRRIVKKGDTVRVSFPGQGDLKMEGVIDTIGDVVSGPENAYPLTVLLKGDSSALKSGMTAKVQLRLDSIKRTKSSILIPVSSFDTRHDDRNEINDAYVWVFRKETSKVELRKVYIGTAHGNLVEVLSGLADGDIIATSGVSFLRKGMTVRLWKPES